MNWSNTYQRQRQFLQRWYFQEQYGFVYDAVLEYWESRNSAAQVAQFCAGDDRDATCPMALFQVSVRCMCVIRNGNAIILSDKKTGFIGRWWFHSSENTAGYGWGKCSVLVINYEFLYGWFISMCSVKCCVRLFDDTEEFSGLIQMCRTRHYD